MSTPTAFKQYSITQLPNSASQIVTVTVNDPTAGAFSAISFTAEKVGKLYTNIRATSVGGGYNNLIVGESGPNTAATAGAAKIAALFGETVNTMYEQQNLYSNAAVPIVIRSGGSWTLGFASSNRYTLLQAFLAN